MNLYYKLVPFGCLAGTAVVSRRIFNIVIIISSGNSIITGPCVVSLPFASLITLQLNKIKFYLII